MLKDLREFCQSQGIQGYILHTTDGFQNYNTIIQKLTNFSGSNGILVLLTDKALFFTDGRYLEQAAKQLDANLFKIFPISSLKDFNWSDFIKPNDTIGYHPMLCTKKQLANFEKLNLSPIKYDELIDSNISDKEEVFVYFDNYAGSSAADKLKKLKGKNYLITDTSSVCYLLNLRSKADDQRGMFNAYLLSLQDQFTLFISENLSSDVLKYLKDLDVKHLPLGTLKDKLTSNKISLDLDTIPLEFLNICTNYEHGTYYKLDQACKTKEEIENAKEVHISDGIAICEVLAWIKEGISEYDISCKLIQQRKKHKTYIKESFHAICGFKENSSIIHYRPLEAEAKKIQGQGLVLIDTGGHYYGATTDVTRVICLGEPTEEEKLYYTLVLKGHINLAKTKFKKGIAGANLDSLARVYLWQNFADYPHSTGHGVGNFLNVHEGPCGISAVNNVVLKEGMILSNEPGFYKEGSFGIRIENLVYVKQSSHPDFLEFEDLTMLPFCSKLIDKTMLNTDEITWIKGYYGKIDKLIMSHLSTEARRFLQEELNAI